MREGDWGVEVVAKGVVNTVEDRFDLSRVGRAGVRGDGSGELAVGEILRFAQDDTIGFG